MPPPKRPSNPGNIDQAMESRSRSGKVIVVGFIAVALGVTLYFAFGISGMDHSGGASTMHDMDMPSGGAHRLVNPLGFEAAFAEPDAVIVNVHVPYDGEIEGTDLFLPYDRIDAASLPSDRDTPLVVYCRSGSMSAKAVVTLAGLGYTNIVELDGGINAWRVSGRQVTMNTSDG